MKREKVYKIVKKGSLVRVKDSYGVVVQSVFNSRNVEYSTRDPYLYKVTVDGSELLLIREAFELVQEP